jgi:hypothetical protein
LRRNNWRGRIDERGVIVVLNNEEIFVLVGVYTPAY